MDVISFLAKRVKRFQPDLFQQCHLVLKIEIGIVLDLSHLEDVEREFIRAEFIPVLLKRFVGSSPFDSWNLCRLREPSRFRLDPSKTLPFARFLI